MAKRVRGRSPGVSERFLSAPRRRRLNERRLDVLLFVALGGLAYWWVTATAFWRDELQAWLVARSASTPWDLWSLLRYEGHPPLYYLLLWPLTHAGLSPDAARFVVVITALGALALLIFGLPLPRYLRLAVGFSAVWVGSYLTEPYALLPLLLLGAYVLDPDGRAQGPRRIGAWLCLGAVGATDLFGLIVAGVLGLRRLRRGHTGWLGPSLALMITGLGLLAALPAADAQSIHLGQAGPSLVSAWHLFGSLVGLQRTSTLLLPGAVLAALGLTMATLSGERRLAWLLVLIGDGILAIISGAQGELQAIPLLVCWVILYSEERKTIVSTLTPTRRLDTIITAVAVIVGLVGAIEMSIALMDGLIGLLSPNSPQLVMLCGTVLTIVFLSGLIMLVRRDRWSRLAELTLVGLFLLLGANALSTALQRPLSAAPAAIQAIGASIGPTVSYLATPDWLGANLSAELDVPVWTPECACSIGPIRWTRARNQASGDPAALRALLFVEAQRRLAAGETVALVLAAGERPPWPAQLVVERQGGQWADEDIVIWLVRPSSLVDAL